MSAASYDILIVGGGQGGRRAAEGARAASASASIAILGEEPHPPYDRPPLSKAALEMDAGLANCQVRSVESYAADRIDLLLGRRAARLDRSARLVVTEGGERIGYGRAILATGSRPRQLPVPPALSDRVMTLRTRDDAARLASHLRPGARIVIIGAGFIGLEVASSALGRGAKVTVLEAATQPLARVLPPAPAERIAALHRRAGVDLQLGAMVKGFAEAGGGRGVCVETSAGVALADIVVVGVGVTPNTELAADAGLAVEDGIIVDEHGATADRRVFAAGEVTRHPAPGAARPVRLESWQVAELQAEAAGRNAAGLCTSHATIPWFWSDQLGANLQMLGFVSQDRPLVVRDYGGGGVAWFALDDGHRVLGAITLNVGRDIAVTRRLMIRNAAIDPGRLADPAAPLAQLLRS